MTKLQFAAGIAALMVCTTVLGADVGLSISLGQPGFFGQVDIGDAPPPRLIRSAPVVGIRVQGEALPPPIYLHVRPGYERHWRSHCREYDACGRPVYFVRDDWYNNSYVPHYREHHRDYGDGRRDEHRDHRRDDHGGQRRDDRGDQRRDEHRDEHRDDHRDNRQDHGENHDDHGRDPNH